ncbi:Uu.00g050900.m01.CDS01 [Anthostomella pinea]|uniref:Uu.00g050900.m01.CDS01 n=1 Tax=Anthostomella pinea TaxID=933095 RepID=A0AAI8VSR1_9PEZI|nr:Uu.00g050900.m01.CDS01 [Anthostomella pinea]
MLSITSTFALLTSLGAVTLASAQTNFEGANLQPNTKVGDYQYLGCANEVPGRTLTAISFSNDSMKIEDCQAYCTKNNYRLSGVEYGQECYCGRFIAIPAALGAYQCNMGCGGNKKQICGGSNRVSIFNNTNINAVAAAPKLTGTWQYQSCFMEPQNSRALDILIKADDNMTIEMCTQACGDAKYPYAGVEYGRECYCGATQSPNLQDASDPTCSMQCDFPCGGNAQQICGGRLTIGIYKNTAKSKMSRAAVMGARKGRFVKVVKESEVAAEGQ